MALGGWALQWIWGAALKNVRGATLGLASCTRAVWGAHLLFRGGVLAGRSLAHLARSCQRPHIE